jgi:hypothetical protein
MAETQQRFEHGQLVATPGALELLGELDVSPSYLLERHLSGDWGEVPKEDARENEFSIKHGFRVVSSYDVGDGGHRVWVITEADRSSTCLLLPEEY